MDTGQLVLQFDLEEGRHADAVVAAETLIAWVAAIREANAVMDPTVEVAVDLISADAACLRLWTALRFIDRQMAKASDKLNEVPVVKKLVSATVIAVPPAVAGAAAVMFLLPDQTVTLSDEGLAKLSAESQKVQEAPAVKSKVQAFYKAAAQDKAITAVSVSEGIGRAPLVKVPREEFAERSGLWMPQEPPAPTRPGGGLWDVVVTHPVAIGKPHVWGFMRDGLPFRAKMTDEAFLAAIKAKTLPLSVQEGVMMRVEVIWQEQLQGQVWIPVTGSFVVVRVLHPRPGGAAGAALPLIGQP